MANINPNMFHGQVLSRLGRVIGAKEVKVGNNKVSIERLNVDVVTGLEMDVHTEATLPGTLVAHLTRKDKLTRKYQVCKKIYIYKNLSNCFQK